MIFENTIQFKNELKKLCKKFRSLEEDFEDLKNFLEKDPVGSILPKNHIVQISGLSEKIKGDFYKIRKFFCKSLKSKGDFRIIYKYSKEDENIIFEKIEFIEIFQKTGKKENHDEKRIEEISD